MARPTSTTRNLQVSPPFDEKTRLVTSADAEIKDEVPVGIDPGWDHNVGEAWISPELALGAKLARLPPELRGPMTNKTISPAYQQALAERWKAFRTGAEAGVTQHEAQVVGFLDSATLDGLGRTRSGA